MTARPVELSPIGAMPIGEPSARSVLVLGANGRLGHACVDAFIRANWRVSAFARSPGRATAGDGVAYLQGDACEAQDVINAALGHAFIVNAVNAGYGKWASVTPRLTEAVCQAAARTGATVILPGNIYHYGARMPPLLSEDTPAAPTSELGEVRLAMERMYASRAQQDGFRVVVLRGGDFLDGHRTGGWFDGQIAGRIDRGRVVYPGRLDVDHQWAYLPDFARGLVALAELREPHPPFRAIGFPGHVLTGRALIDALSEITGRDLKVGQIPWSMLKLFSAFSPDIKGVTQMAYLWDIPHAIDRRPFDAMFPDFQLTPTREALAMAVADLLPPASPRPRHRSGF